MSNFAVPMSLPRFSAAKRDATSDFAPARLAACVAFAVVDDSEIPEATSHLYQLLTDPVADIRAQSVESLASLAQRGGEIDHLKLLPLLEDTCLEVQAALLQSGQFLLADPLAAALLAATDDDALIRYSAAVLLGALTPKESLLSLHKLLDDADDDVRLAAAFQLGSDGNDTSAALLESVVENRDDAAPIAISILASLKLSRSKPVLQKLAARRFGSVELKALACAALACYPGNNEEFVASLRELLLSKRKSRRMAALMACAAIPLSGFAPTLATFVRQSASDDEKSAALFAIWKTTDFFPETAAYLDEIRPELNDTLQRELNEYAKGKQQ